jgi:hypothetical protein
LAKPLDFGHLSLNDPEYDISAAGSQTDSDTRLMEMMAAQAAHHSGPGLEDEQAVASDEKLSDEEKKEKLQKALHMAASNGDVERVQNLLKGLAKQYVDVNAPDEDGTPPLIYASCFVSFRRMKHPVIRLMLYAGSRAGGTGLDRCRRRCRQTRPQSMECPHVGYDEPP